jgi:AraC-like DNA-binding protein
VKADEKIIVDAGSYCAQFTRRSHDLLYMHREVRHDKIDRDVDVFGRYWVFSWGNVAPGIIHAKRDGQLIPISGMLNTFLPPFGVVEWEIHPGIFQFHTILSSARLPAEMPREPVCWFDGLAGEPPSAASAIRRVLDAKNPQPIGPCSNPSAIARRAKSWFDGHYAEPTPIAAVADALHVSHTVMGRLFRRDYRLAPVAYRNKLRISDSLRLMLFDNQKVSNAAYEVGFEDLSRYNRLFRQHMKINPAKYR